MRGGGGREKTAESREQRAVNCLRHHCHPRARITEIRGSSLLSAPCFPLSLYSYSIPTRASSRTTAAASDFLSLQRRKQRHSNSLAARIWSGKPKQSVQRSSRARQAQSQEKSKHLILPPASTSTVPVKSAQPETPDTRTASIVIAGSVDMSWASTRRTFIRGALGRTTILSAWPVAAKARTSRLKASVALEAPMMWSIFIRGWDLIW